MGKIIDRIKMPTVSIPEDAIALQKETIPLFLYGNSKHAKKVINNFDKIGLTIIKGVVVSNEYYDKDNTIFDNRYKIYSLSEIEKEYPKVSFVAGYNWYEFVELTQMLCSLPFVHKLYINEGISYKDFNYPQYEKIAFLDWHSFQAKKRNITWDFIKENEELLQQTYDWLQDELSKDTMIRYLEGLIHLKSFPMKDLCLKNQYFEKEIMHLEESEIFVDCGAYNGDTIEAFIQNVDGMYEKIYAMEPDRRFYTELLKNIKGGKKIYAYNKGAYREDTKLAFSTEGCCGSIKNDGDEEKVEVSKIDTITAGERVTFIKMDIEGAELDALYGAEETIRKFKPKLAICVYHKMEDLIEIPRYIKKLVPEYKLYLRGYSECAAEVVLYSVSE